MYNFNSRGTSATVGLKSGQYSFAVAIREMPTSPGNQAIRILSWLIAFLAISAAYLYTFPQANILYAVVVLLHAAGGAARRDIPGSDAVSSCCAPAHSPREQAGC